MGPAWGVHRSGRAAEAAWLLVPRGAGTIFRAAVFRAPLQWTPVGRRGIGRQGDADR